MMDTGPREEPQCGHLDALSCGAGLPSLEYPAIAELAAHRQWVLHREKVPMQPNGIHASSTSAATWSAFDECAQTLVGGDFSGVGFVFSPDDDYVGIDFDHVLDEMGEIIDPRIAEMVAELDSYTEISPGGDGLHVFVKGTLPSSIKTDHVEMYSEGRYFTVTGSHYAGAPETINHATGAVEAILGRLRATKPKARLPLIGESIGEGSRHNFIVARAAELREKGLSETELLGAVTALNESRCNPPLPDDEVRDIIEWAGRTVEAAAVVDPVEDAATIVDAVFTGSRFTALADRPAPPPILPLHSPRGHFSVAIGASFVGKSSVQYHLAMCRATGVAAWEGLVPTNPEKTLIYSPDEPVEQIARRMRGIAQNLPVEARGDYADRLLVLGLDPDVDADLLGGLRLNRDGIARWDNMLEALRPDSVVIDAYGDVLPEGVSENDNDHAREVGGALEGLAVKHGIPITALHHLGKLPPGMKSEDIDVRDLGRGASALAQKARAVFTVEEVAGQNHLRRTRCRTNLGRTPAPLELEVCEMGLPSPEILYFRPHDPLSHHRPSDYLDHEWISTTELARRLDRKMNGAKEDREPPGAVKTLAGELRREWVRLGLCEIRDGARGAKEMKLNGGANG